MRAKQQRRARREGALEIFDVDAIGRADLDERRAAAFEHVGNAKSAADLDELTARDDHFASLRKRIEHEQDGRRAVIDDQRILRAGDLLKRPPTSRRSASRARRVRGRIRGSSSRCATRSDCVKGIFRQRGAAEVGMKNDAGCVDDERQRLSTQPPQPLLASSSTIRRTLLRHGSTRAAEYLVGRALTTFLPSRISYGAIRSSASTPCIAGIDFTPRVCRASTSRCSPGRSRRSDRPAGRP